MDAKITGETDELLGLSVVDHDGVEHLIEMEYDGEVTGHDQDAYPDDPAERTSYEDEMVAQAWLRARLHVYRERGHDTLPAGRNPDRIAATLLTIAGMSEDEIETHFGEFYRQARGHFEEGVSRPLELDPGPPDDRPVIYRQDVALDEKICALEGTHGEHASAIGDLADASALSRVGEGFAELFTDPVSALESVFDPDDTAGAHDRATDVPSFDLGDVSGLYYMYHQEDASLRTVSRGSFERDADASFQMMAPPVGSPGQWRTFLVHHLACQIRDVYVGSGLVPPEPYRLLGFGLHDYFQKYRHFDCYPELFDPDADVDWESAPDPTEDDGLLGVF